MREILFVLPIVLSCTILGQRLGPPPCKSQSPRCDGSTLIHCESDVEVVVSCSLGEVCNEARGVCGSCGDGEVDPQEDCDGQNLNGESCSGLGFLSGTLGCSPLCSFDVAGCVNNEPPVANNQVVDTNEDTPRTINLTATDLENDAFTFSIVNLPQNGTLDASNFAAGEFIYTPSANFNGSDSFTVIAIDTAPGLSATIAVNVDAINDSPNALPQTIVVQEDEQNIPFTLQGTDIEDGSSLTFLIEAAPSNGTIDASNLPNVLYTPDANFSGTDTLLFSVSDSSGSASDFDFLTFDVQPVNDAPNFGAISDQTVNENAGITNVNITDVSAGPTDEVGQTVTVTAVSSNEAIVPNPTINGFGATRTLSFQPAANKDGTATITVTAQDNGGPANGGVDTFQRTFIIAVANVPQCGDSFVDFGEECDDGSANSDTIPDACRSTCLNPICGDGVADTGEACDDTDGIEGDGCDTNCTISDCGNNIVAPGEICFGTPITFFIGFNINFVGTGDLDGDSDLDLVTANGNNDSVSIFKNNGFGSFSLSSNISVGDQPLKAVISDFDFQNGLDIATINNQGRTSSILLNNGLGQFSSVNTISVGDSQPKIIKPGDIDNDGDVDLVVHNLSPNSYVTRLFNNGAGQFTANTSLQAGGLGLGLGIVNNDLFLDIVVSDDGNPGRINVFFNDGFGNYPPSQTDFFSNGVAPTRVEVFDSDGDSDSDMVVSNERGLNSFTNNSIGQFTQTSVNGLSNHQDTTSADVDNDGDFDIILLDLTTGSLFKVIIFANNGSGIFSGVFSFNSEQFGLASAGDLNGDGASDLVFGIQSTQSIGLLLANP